MFRNLLLATAALVGVAVPLGGLATADAAHPGRVEVRHRVVHERCYVPPVCVAPAPVYCTPPVVTCPTPVYSNYCVEYRRTCNDPWIAYGSYATGVRAREFVGVLGHRGFETRIRHH